MPAPNTETEQALVAARWEAHLTGRPHLDSAHLLLGLLHLPQCRAVRALRALGVEPRWDRLRGPVSDGLAAAPGCRPAAGPARARGTAGAGVADSEAQSQGREMMGLPDLVIGLLCEKSGLGGLLLRAHGLSADKARRAFNDASD